MSLVTVIKDYFEIVHKIIETSPAYLVQHTTYTDSTTLYFYLINTVKNLFTDFFSLNFFQRIASFPIIVPTIADSMISEISVLDGTFHNLFTFLDAPIFTTKNDFIAIVCLEKFFIGLFNSIFLWLPTCAATFLCLRRFVMQGMEIGYIAAIGTMTANIFWLICVLFGVRSIVIPWMSLDILRYWLGFMLLIKYFWDNRLPAKEIKSDISLNIIKTKFGLNSVIAIFVQSFQFHGNFSNPIQQVFFFHFLLAFTEQTSLYPFLSHFSLSAQSTYLESFPSNNFIDFLIINSFYLLGIFIGSFSFINLICWFWEEPAYKVYLWTTKNFQKMRVGDMVRITHFIFQTLTILLACASLPYFSIEYFITKPLGFLPNDEIFHQSQNNAFLTHSTSPVLYRSPYYFPRQRFFRYDDWAEYYGKNIPLDTSLYDQGAYRLYPIEDLHFGADYEWTRRRSNHVKIRSRMKRIMWFPRNWATQIWDLAKTWSRRNVAWRNEILSQYQNNWDSKSAPFWEQIIQEDLLFGKKKSKDGKTGQSSWAASQNWSHKFLISGEGFWWNWWSKNTISDNKIWWNWILTKNKQIIIDNSNPFSSKRYQQNGNQLTSSLLNINENNNQPMSIINIKRGLLFSNYQKLPSSYRLDYWLPQERLISLYSEQSQKQKNQLIYEIATLRKFVRKINKRIDINSNIKVDSRYASPLYTIFSIKNGELYYNKYVFSNSFKSLINNLKNRFFSNQGFFLDNQKDQLIIDSHKILNSLLNGYSLANQSNTFNKFNNIEISSEKSIGLLYHASRLDNFNHYTNNFINIQPNSEASVNTIKQRTPNFSKNNNFFINQSQQHFAPSSSLFLTLPAYYYLHREQSFSRKLQFYGVRTSREFKPLNNSPIFNFYMKTFFHQYKPIRLYIANTKMKRDLGAGGRNRFKSRQYANKQLKKARILSKTPWIRQWISQSGFLTRRKRLESWIRYSHYNSNEIWAFILRADIDNFIKRQPSYHLLTTNEERLLHLRRFLLGEHYEALRWYSYMQHYRSMKVKIGGTKSFVNRMYNQQFKGTFHKVRHLFALTPSLNGGGMLTFDQLLYNEFPNENKNSILNKELIHEELLSESRREQKVNINSFLVKDKKNQSLNLNFYSNDLIIQLSQIIKEYILEIIPNRQKFIQKLLKDKNYVDLTNILWSGWSEAGFNKNFLTNNISKRIIVSLHTSDSKEKSMRSSFSIDQQKKFQSMLILIFNKRRSLAKDYKKGSERLWKKWRKKYLIQKQIHKQNNIGILEQHLVFSNNFYKNYHPIEQKALPIYRTNNEIKKIHVDYQNTLKNNVAISEEKIPSLFTRYQKQSTIRKALKDSISIQKYIFKKNTLERKTENAGFSLTTKNNYFNKKAAFHNKTEDKTNINVEKMLYFTKNNFQSKLLSADKIVIKDLINNIYKKIKVKYFTLDYWFKNITNLHKKNWHVLHFNKESKSYIKIKNQNNNLLKKKNKQEVIFSLLSYLQNKTIQQRLNINKKILTMKNYNQIDRKFFMVRASRHFKRARISQRKKLSQPIKKYKNFFHIETENINKFNPFQIYQTVNFSMKIAQFVPSSDLFSSGKISTLKPALLNSNSIMNIGLKKQHIYNKMKNIIQSYNIDLINENKKKAVSNTFSVHKSDIFNVFQPFLESLYYVPRLSTLWQSNLINANIHLKSKIDMGSAYETKQYFSPIGIHKELFRQNFNTKNKIQDNIKRKLLDNHLNRFSERRRWNSQYKTINIEMNEQLKKIFERIKQNQNIVFNNKKAFNSAAIPNQTLQRAGSFRDLEHHLFHKKKIKQVEIQYNKNSPQERYSLHPKHQKQVFFSLPLQKSLQKLNIKEIYQLQLLSSIIDQKEYRQSPINFYQFSLLHLKYLFNKFNKKIEYSFGSDKNQYNNRSSWNKNISHVGNLNYDYSKIKEFIMMERSGINRKSIPRFNKEFFDLTKLNNLRSSLYPKIKKEIINQKKLFFTSSFAFFEEKRTHIQIKNAGKNTHDGARTLLFAKHHYKTSQVSKNVKDYLINNIEQQIEKQLQKLENRLKVLNTLTNEKEQNTDKSQSHNAPSSINVIQKQNKILTTQKKLIIKRIQFLTNLSIKLKAFDIQGHFAKRTSLPKDWPSSTKEIKIINNGAPFFGFKNKKQQYYLSKKSLNLLVENAENFIQYLNIKKNIYLKKQNKIFFYLLKNNLILLSETQIKKEINTLETPYSMNNIIEKAQGSLLSTNFKMQKFVKKPIKKLNNSKYKKLLERILKSQQSVSYFATKTALSVDSSIMKPLLKKQKLANFEETLGSLLAIQKRGNALSQKNIYYKTFKQEWNKNKLNIFSKSFSKRFNKRWELADFSPSSKNDAKKYEQKYNFYEEMFNLSNSGIGKQSGINNYIGIRNWTRAKQNFNETQMNPILFKSKDYFNSHSLNSLIFEKKKTYQHFLSIDNFIKESLLKPQRFEKQQSRKRLKFKKLPRQEHFKNLQFWDNYFKQKEDIKNKLFFDDLSISFQKWRDFGFFPQKKVFQKQVNNFSTFFPSSIYTVNNKKSNKFANFYDTNFQTITNLDIIKQIEYDHLIQKELNIFINSDSSQTNINSNLLNNKKILQMENNKSLNSVGILAFKNQGTDSASYLKKLHDPYASLDYPLVFSKDVDIGNHSELYLKTNQEQIDYLDKDIISKIYDKFFVKSLRATVDQSQINKKNLIGINTSPFYAGWDESLRKFVITNRLLSRRDAGYFSNKVFKEERSDSNEFNIEFRQWPLQGRNAATTFFCHLPFINQPPDFSETIQYKNRTQFQQEDVNSASLLSQQNEKQRFVDNNKLLGKNKTFAIKRIKKQKQLLRNENRRNITNLVGPNEIQKRRFLINNPLKWRSLKSNTKKIILKFPEEKTEIQNHFTLSDYIKYKKTNNIFLNSSILKEKDKNYVRNFLSKFHLLRILRKGNTGKIRLTKLRPYKKYIKKENDILESSWRTFLSKRKLRSYNFVRQKNIKTMHLFKSQLGKRFESIKMQWLFRKNNSRANRQSENRKNKSGAHYLHPRKKSLRRRSLGIKYKRNQQISSLNNLCTNQCNLGIIKQSAIDGLSIYPSSINYNQHRGVLKIKKKMMALALFSSRHGITDFSNFDLLKYDPIMEETSRGSQNKIKFYQTPFNWVRPNNSNNLFQTPSIYTPTLYSTLPGHGRFLPKVQTMPLPKSSVQTIKRAVRLANFEPASFIQREVLSYEWSMKQLIHNMTSRLNNTANGLILKSDDIDKKKQNESPLGEDNAYSSSFSIDLILQRHLRLFKKKLIHNPTIVSSSNAYLSEFSRQRTFQKRSIRLRKFNMTLAMNLYDRWFFYYYTGGREDPLQNLFQNFGKLAQNISSSNNNIKFNQGALPIFDNSKMTIDNLDNFKKNVIFKSIRKFLTQKPDQKRSFNTFLTNLKTKKSSSFSKILDSSNKQQNILNSTNQEEERQIDNDKAKNRLSFQSSIDGKFYYSDTVPLHQWWHLFKLFPETIHGELAQKEMLVKISSNKKQKKQQEKDLEEDRFYFLKANKSPIIQDFRSSKNVNRHYPLNGGFIWPGDYLRLQTIMLPKEKKYQYFYNKNIVSEIQNSGKFTNKNVQTSKSIIDSNPKINDKIKEYQNFILKSK